MTDIRKVSAATGAQWLLGGFALLRRAPLPLGLLGLIWGGLSALGSLGGQLWLSLLMAVAGPILFGGVVHAVREVEQGRAASPAHLLQAVREGKAARLLVLLLPQVLAMLAMVLLLAAILGPQQLQQVAQVMQQMQANPDPELMQSLPMGRLFAWMAASLVVAVIAGLFTFLAVPELMFRERGALAAMGLSLRACLRNLGAVLVLVVMLVLALFGVSLALQLVGALLAPLLGTAAAMLVMQALLMAVLAPVTAGAAYLAWRQALDRDAGAAPAVVHGFEA